MQLNASRLKVLQAQDDLVNLMKDTAGKELLRIADEKKAYGRLLKDLIVQVPYCDIVQDVKKHETQLIIRSVSSRVVLATWVQRWIHID